MVFLDFSEPDFDEEVNMKPITTPDRDFWESLHESVLEDLSGLLAPEKIIVCESEPEISFDADCYNKIFAKSYPEALFVSAGNHSVLDKIVSILQNVIQKAEIFAVRDRDELLDEERDKFIAEGKRVLTRRTIEDYLIDDEVLEKFAVERSLDDDQLQELKNINQNNDTAKARSGDIFQKIRGYKLTVGETREGFLSGIMAPLLSEELSTYQELEKDIFGDSE